MDAAILDYLYPRNAQIALERWDSREAVLTVMMGGIKLGPGYEQAIHVCVFEMIRACLNHPVLKYKAGVSGFPDFFDSFTKQTFRRLAKNGKNLNLTGAQEGAVKSLVYHFLADGYRYTLEQIDRKTRLTQVSNVWPVPPERGERSRVTIEIGESQRWLGREGDSFSDETKFERTGEFHLSIELSHGAGSFHHSGPEKLNRERAEEVAEMMVVFLSNAEFAYIGEMEDD